MRKLFLGLMMLAMVACRSVPPELVENNNSIATEAGTAFVLVDEVLNKANTDGTEVIGSLANEWADHFNSIMQKRVQVAQYLAANPSDKDVSDAYRVGTTLLADIDLSMNVIFQNWELWLSSAPETDPASKEEFSAKMRKDIVRFNELQAKFTEWLKQFPVKENK